MIELIGVRIWAIPFQDRRRLAPRKLPCGVVVRDLAEDQRPGSSSGFPDRFELPNHPGVFVAFSGFFLLSTGEPAAVYGAIQEPLG